MQTVIWIGNGDPGGSNEPTGLLLLDDDNLALANDDGEFIILE